MRVEGTRLRRDGGRALIAALASSLLASCATTESDVPFGFAMADIAPEISQSQMGTPIEGGFITSQTDPVFIIEEGDPALPDTVIAAPLMRPGSEADSAAVQIANTPDQPAEAQIQANSAPAQQQAGQVPLPTPASAAATGPTDLAQMQADQTQTETPIEMAAATPEAAAPAKKRSFLSAFFSPSATSAQNRPRPLIDPSASAPAMASASSTPQPIVNLDTTANAAPSPRVTRDKPTDNSNPLPGVRQNSLFEITRRSGIDDDSDIDLHEGDEPNYQLASAAGMARLAPNGLVRQTDNVDVACLKPSLVRVLKAVERHYGRKVVVTSGYRSPDRNRRARGARNSLHMYCAAADVQVEGVSKWDLAQYVRSMPGRGGVGTYCHTESVHIDVGPERDWNWRCRRRK